MTAPPRRKLVALAPLALGLAAAALTGCAHEGPPASAPAALAIATAAAPVGERSSETTLTADGTYAAAAVTDRGAVAAGGSWIGAKAVHDVVAASSGVADIGLWVDAPNADSTRRSRRPRVDVALVIDVSGSMAGVKFAHAKEAARTIIDGLADGDIVSVDSFADVARGVCPPLVLDASSRVTLRRAVDGMHVGGNTDMFDGLELAEFHAAQAPASHAVRRVVMLSDGRANVGASSAEMLGAIAENGIAKHTQVTSLGLGLDYDEETLDALAVRSGGRMYHLTDSGGVTAPLRDELALLTSAVASDAYVEVIPAPGVQVERIFGVGGWHGEATASSDGGTPTLRIPLGSLFAGQHREALVRVRFDSAAATWRGQPRALASVRLHFRDLGDDSVDRVQETVARVRTSDDAAEVVASLEPQAQAIAVSALSHDVLLTATEDAEHGDFAAASKKLASVGAELRHRAASAPPAAKPRMLKAADDADVESRAIGAATAAPAPVRREAVLKMNSYGMKSSGY